PEGQAPPAAAPATNGAAHDKPAGSRGLGAFWKRSAPAAPQAAATAEGGDAAKAAAKPKKRKRRRRRYDAPPSAVSLGVPVVELTPLGAAPLPSDVQKAVANNNSALISGKGAEEEVLHVLAEPAAERSTEAVGSEGSPTAAGGGGGGGFSGIGTGPP